MNINDFPVVKVGIQDDVSTWVVTQIDHISTIQDFDNLRQSFPTFKLEHEGRCHWTVLKSIVSDGKLEILDHIVKQGGRHLLDDQGAIFFAKDYQTAKKIIQLGASANVIFKTAKMTMLFCLLFNRESKARSKMIELLLLHGGVAYPMPCPEKLQIIQNSVQKIFEKTKAKLILTAYEKNKFSAFGTLPKDLLKNIIGLLLAFYRIRI